MEIFSTDTFEPWTFQFHSSALFIAISSDPDAFGSSIGELKMTSYCEK